MALELIVFSKKRKTEDGRAFTTYFTRLGTDESPVSVKFREECGAPSCPRIISIEKGDANLAQRKFKREVIDEKTGVPVEQTITTRELWISKWTDIGEYVDHSLDEYFDK